MPRPKKVNPKDAGRPKKPIDWDHVDLMLKAGSPGTEIAARFHMHPNNFYLRCQIEKGIGFTEYSHYVLSTGKTNIRIKHYTKAISGDNTMLLHCAKHLLGQWDTQEKDSSPKEEDIELKKNLYAALHELQELRNELNDLKSKTGQELQRSDAPIQPMDRGGIVGEDVCEPGQVN